MLKGNSISCIHQIDFLGQEEHYLICENSCINAFVAVKGAKINAKSSKLTLMTSQVPVGAEDYKSEH